MASKKNPFPCPTSYHTALRHYVDIASTPRTHVLKELIEYAQDEKDREFLKNLTAPTEEGKVCSSVLMSLHTQCSLVRNSVLRGSYMLYYA